MPCVKLLGPRLTARDFDRQVARGPGPCPSQAPSNRCDSLNGFTAPGTPITELAEQACPGKGEVRPLPDLCSRAQAARPRSSGAPLSLVMCLCRVGPFNYLGSRRALEERHWYKVRNDR